MRDHNSVSGTGLRDAESNRQIGIIFLLSLAIMYLEWVLLSSVSSLKLLLLFHGLIVCCCLFVLWACFRSQWDTACIFRKHRQEEPLAGTCKTCRLRFPVLMLILVTFLGPFGALICAVTVALYKVYSRSSHTLTDLLSSLFPETPPDATAALYERIIYGLDDYEVEYRPMPFMDVMSFGTEKQKRLAIEKMLRYFRPVFAPALRKALHDPSNSIRVLAATAVTTLDQLYFEQYLSLEEKYRACPEDRKTVLAFAEHCDQYASSQILDKDRWEKMVSLAIEGYEKCLEMDPDNPVYGSILGRLYITNKQPEKAKSLLERFITTSSKIPSHMSAWYACALYELKQYAALRDFIAKKVAEKEEQSLLVEEKDLIATWCPELVAKKGEVCCHGG